MDDFLYLLALAVWMAMSCCPVAITSCCCACPCVPDNSFQIDIVGVVNGTSGVCTSCNNFNGTYFLTPSTTTCTGFAEGVGSCFWKFFNLTMGDPCNGLNIGGIPCAGVCVSLRQFVDLAVPNTYQTEVLVYSRNVNPLGGGAATCAFGQVATPSPIFRKNFGVDRPDCSDYNPADIPFIESNLGGGGASGPALCDWRASTVQATAV